MADSFSGLGAVTTIFDIDPNWENHPSGNYLILRHIHAYSGTAMQLSSISDFSVHRFSMFFSNLDKEEENKLIDFFISRKGRYQKFWMYFPCETFLMSETLGSGMSIMRVEDNGFNDIYLGHERIFILLKNDDILIRQITGVSKIAGEKLDLTLDTASDRTILTSDIAVIGRLLLMRFDNDSLNLNFLGRHVSEATLNFVELVEEYNDL